MCISKYHTVVVIVTYRVFTFLFVCFWLFACLVFFSPPLHVAVLCKSVCDVISFHVFFPVISLRICLLITVFIHFLFVSRHVTPFDFQSQSFWVEFQRFEKIFRFGTGTVEDVRLCSVVNIFCFRSSLFSKLSEKGSAAWNKSYKCSWKCQMCG